MLLLQGEPSRLASWLPPGARVVIADQPPERGDRVQRAASPVDSVEVEHFAIQNPAVASALRQHGALPAQLDPRGIVNVAVGRMVQSRNLGVK